MAKRNWKDHTAVGRQISVGDVEVTIVDVKAGPMHFNPDDLEGTDIKILGSLKLRVKYPGGHECWIGPVNSGPLLEWCERQDAAKPEVG